MSEQEEDVVRDPASVQQTMMMIKGLGVLVLLALLVGAGLLIKKLTTPAPAQVKASGDIVFQINDLESRVKAFKADTGVFPVDLKDLNVADVAELVTPGVDAAKFNGPYFDPPYATASNLPENPYGTPGNPDWHAYWTYDPATGEVHSAVDGKTTTGEDIKTL